MPAVVVGAASMWSGVTAWAGASTMWATVAAGAEIVGGAMSLWGAATGNEKLAKNGMVIGGLGGLGSMAIESFGANAAKAGAEAVKTAAPGVVAEAVTPVDAALGATSGTIPAPAVGTATTGTTNIAATTQELTAKYDALTKEMMKQNTRSQVIAGLGQGAQAYMEDKTKRDMMDEEKRRYERNYANRSNVGLKLPQVTMPKLGLIQPKGV